MEQMTRELGFMGTYTPKLDEKGRLILPAKFRDELSAGLVLSRGQERCIYVFPFREWARMQELLRQAPVTSKQGRDFLRLLHSGADDQYLDKQGRITVPGRLREYADLERDCIVIGSGSRIEIWNAASWESYIDEQEAAFADTREEVIPGLF